MRTQRKHSRQAVSFADGKLNAGWRAFHLAEIRGVSVKEKSGSREALFFAAIWLVIFAVHFLYRWRHFPVWSWITYGFMSLVLMRAYYAKYFTVLLEIGERKVSVMEFEGADFLLSRVLDFPARKPNSAEARQKAEALAEEIRAKIAESCALASTAIDPQA